MEALYPAGIGADGDPKDGDFSIGDISNAFKRVLPHRTYKKRYNDIEDRMEYYEAIRFMQPFNLDLVSEDKDIPDTLIAFKSTALIFVL